MKRKLNLNSIPGLLDFYVRIILLTLAVTAGAMFLFAGARMALAANLKPASVISTNVLTLGDLFDGLSVEKASYVLGPAPQPGQDMVLNARTLMRIAAAMDLPWQPATSAEQIVVRRSVTQIDSNMIYTLIENRLRDDGIGGTFDIKFSTATKPVITLPGKQDQSAEIKTINFDPQKDSFSVTIAAPSVHNAITEKTINGTVQRVVSIPVLKNTLRAGDIIGARDLVWVDLYNNDLQHSFVLKEESLIGMTPRRMITAGKPIRDKEIERPTRVSRGDFVTLVYQSGPIHLTAKGKALQNGADGDLVRIVNINSNRSLDGIVTGDREVTLSQ